METKRFFDPEYFGMNRKNVFFAETREEKVKKIGQLKCSSFIDDLPEVFAEENFPRGTQKVLFGQFDNNNYSDVVTLNNWTDIFTHLLGSSIDDDVSMWANLLLNNSVASVEKILGGGNSFIYKIRKKFSVT